MSQQKQNKTKQALLEQLGDDEDEDEDEGLFSDVEEGGEDGFVYDEYALQRRQQEKSAELRCVHGHALLILSPAVSLLTYCTHTYTLPDTQQPSYHRRR
jgi:hypothetical protein